MDAQPIGVPIQKGDPSGESRCRRSNIPHHTLFVTHVNVTALTRVGPNKYVDLDVNSDPDTEAETENETDSEIEMTQQPRR